MAETGYYDSPMTGEELDAAFAKMAGIDESVRQAGQSAETARQYGQIVEQNAQAIRDIEENLDVILEAPSQAQAASQSAERAAAARLRRREQPHRQDRALPRRHSLPNWPSRWHRAPRAGMRPRNP